MVMTARHLKFSILSIEVQLVDGTFVDALPRPSILVRLSAGNPVGRVGSFVGSRGPRYYAMSVWFQASSSHSRRILTIASVARSLTTHNCSFERPCLGNAARWLCYSVIKLNIHTMRTHPHVSSFQRFEVRTSKLCAAASVQRTQ